MSCRWFTSLALLFPLLVPTIARAQEDPHQTEATEKIPAEPGRFKKEFKPDLEKVVDGIIAQTNEFRKEQELSKVEREPKLMKTAQDFADFMAENDLYGHLADEQTPAQRAKAHEYNYCLVLENIAYQYKSNGFKTEELAENFVTGWKESPGHRKNMLDPSITETGVAVSYSERSGHYYAVQMFGRPKSAAVEFQLSNSSNQEVSYQVADQTFKLEPRMGRIHTLCRSPELTIKWTDDNNRTHSRTLNPENGDQFTIEDEAGKIQIQKESAASSEN